MSTFTPTTEFLAALHKYLGGKISARIAAEKANLSSANRFLEKMQAAYREGYIVVRSPINSDLARKIRDWLGLASRVDPTVVCGDPDDTTFYEQSAEIFLRHLKRFLYDKNKNHIRIGIISGSNTGGTIKSLVNGNLWDYVIGDFKNDPGDRSRKTEKRHITVIALNSPSLKEPSWELQGNSNIVVIHLATLLEERLGENFFEIKPKGISKELIVPANKDADEDSYEKDLDIVLTGVGVPDNSLFCDILKDARIPIPNDMAGDLGYWPMRANGDIIPLIKDQQTYRIYSAISLSGMKKMVENGRVVMLIARNSRNRQKVNKTDAIRAALCGQYVNVLVSDEVTAIALLKKDPPRLL